MNDSTCYVTACHRGDVHLAAATLASIRHFAPDAPICLIVDGDVDVSSLVKTYGAKTIFAKDVADEELRHICSGSTKSKLLAFFYLPFDRFVWLDSDAVLWGDIRSSLRWEQSDFIAFVRPNLPVPPLDAIHHYFFNTELLRDLDLEVPLDCCKYFCAGVFASRTSVLSAARLKELVNLQTNHPGLFQFWDQGLVNYHVAKEAYEGRVRLTTANLQYIPIDYPLSEFEQHFTVAGIPQPGDIEKPTVVHFCGVKPLLQYSLPYGRLFAKFRLLHLRNAARFRWALTGVGRIAAEEMSVLVKRASRRLSDVLKRKPSA